MASAGRRKSPVTVIAGADVSPPMTSVAKAVSPTMPANHPCEWVLSPNSAVPVLPQSPGMSCNADAVPSDTLMERCAEVLVKAPDGRSIGPESARRVHDEFDEVAAWQVFQWAQRSYVADVSVVGQ